MSKDFAEPTYKSMLAVSDQIMCAKVFFNSIPENTLHDFAQNTCKAHLNMKQKKK